MHEENFLSSFLREDGKEKEGRLMERGKETNEERGKKRWREEEKEENETGTVERRCEGFVSVEALEFFVKGEIWRVVVIFPGKTSWRSLRICLVVSRRLGWLCLRCLM